jgi:type IV secretory pathway VirB3-like protein
MLVVVVVVVVVSIYIARNHNVVSIALKCSVNTTKKRTFSAIS